MKSAVAYFRTSSVSNVGPDKDSEKRQRAAVRAYADANDIRVVQEFYDAGVSGTLPVEDRPAFSELLSYVISDGARTVLIESPDRFARDTVASINGVKLLKDEGITLIPASAPDHYLRDDPDSEMVQEIQAAVEKRVRRQVVLRLKAARDRQSREKGYRIEGRKLHAPREHVVLTKNLRAGGFSYRKIAAELESKGMLHESGKRYHPNQVKRMALGRNL